MNIVDWLLERKRLFFLVLFLIVVAGVRTFLYMPKESFPEIKMPFIFTTITQRGISPDDAERLIAKPLEKEFKTIQGIKILNTRCFEGWCIVIAEFHSGLDSEKSLREAKDAVDRARPKLPKDADEPTVFERSTADFPIAIVNIFGTAPERALGITADRLRDMLETIPGVVEADVGGKREEQIEIQIDPVKIDSYRLSAQAVAQLMAATNVLIPAGNIETARGSFPIKVPSLIEGPEDLLALPVITTANAAITLADIADIRRMYKDAKGFVRMNGVPSLSIEIKKRSGANTIATMEGVRYALEQAAKVIPANIATSIANDASVHIRNSLSDLGNSVIFAVLLVVLCIVMMLGLREGLLVGVSIPLSFVLGVLFLSSALDAINMMVLFGMILSVGLLIDGAIVITEYADQLMTAGADRKTAYSKAAKRMFMVITLSTLTTLMAFMPLFRWPGQMGEFMKFLPITVSAILAASLVVALIFIPVLGATFGSKTSKPSPEKKMIVAASNGHYEKLAGYMRVYLGVLSFALKHPKKIIASIVGVLILTLALYTKLGVGIQLFPDAEPDFININVHARGNLSTAEKDSFVHSIEEKISELPYFKNVYGRSGARSRMSAEDVVGYVQVELKDWDQRPKASIITGRMEEALRDSAGFIPQVMRERRGPGSAKPIDIRVSALDEDPRKIDAGYKHLREAMDIVGGFTNIDDTTSLPGIQWEMRINKAQAAKLGVSVGAIGSVVQMLTHGAKVSSYMPGDLDEEIDIVIRFPERFRTLDQIGNLYVVGANGRNVPLSSFTQIVPTPKTHLVQRMDGKRVIRMRADVASGLYAADRLTALQRHLASNPPPSGVEFLYRGEAQDSAENSGFLGQAFMLAIGMMFVILIAQFNSFYSVFIILFSILLSTIGVFLGLMITRDPFSIVMTGLAIISLGGVITNNNIILIDTYNDMKKKTKDTIDALKRTGLSRLRPIYLTTITTMLGMLPMALKMNMDFLSGRITFGNPSMDTWAAFSRSIIFGLSFATILTLIITPCMLLLGDKAKAKIKARLRKKAEK
ncbi:MAG: efflux RND transporter permease subunit [Alphaproteobacteria bacterium]|nr:efflux RND transporter permease subunit [Alphaproteobacteria bacterium]